MAKITPDKTLNVYKFNCPLPVLKTKKVIKELQSGQVLELITKDPEAKVNIPIFCKRAGHQLLEMIEKEGKIIFYIRRK